MTANLAVHSPAKTEILTIISASLLAKSTKRQYTRVIEGYLDAGHSLADADALRAYSATLSKSGKAFLKAALKLWTQRMATQAKAAADPENVNAVTATLYRLDALNEAIQVEASKGTKAHIWLSPADVRKLLAACDVNTLKGQRDRIALGLLAGAGLRREELANLTFDALVEQPIGDATRIVLNVHGKGAKDRVVPLSNALSAAIQEWQAIIGEGYIVRSVTKGGVLGKRLSSVGIYHLVAEAGAAIGKLGLAPHDLRRSYAQIGLEAGIPLPQISKLLGHASIATTQRYLNLELDLTTTISDFVPFV